jgi:hypothetical protein
LIHNSGDLNIEQCVKNLEILGIAFTKPYFTIISTLVTKFEPKSKTISDKSERTAGDFIKAAIEDAGQ